MLKQNEQYKIAVKYCKTKINGYGVNFGLKTLTENYLKNFADWYENPTDEYDIVFCIGANPEEVNAKHIVYLCASQNNKSYNNVEKCNFVQYADGYTDVILVRYNECYEQIVRDFPNCNVFCKNFILFDFSDKYISNDDRSQSIVHLGRICEFKNSIELLRNPTRYISNIPLCSYGGNLFKIDNGGIFLSDKMKKLYNPKYHCIHSTMSEQPETDRINFYPNYSSEQLYDIAKRHQFSIMFYDEDFRDNVEYAMLEMINAGCFPIMNESYVETFNEQSVLDEMPFHFELCDDENLAYVLRTKTKGQIKKLTRKNMIRDWKRMYDNEKVLQSLIDGMKM